MTNDNTVNIGKNLYNDYEIRKAIYKEIPIEFENPYIALSEAYKLKMITKEKIPDVCKLAEFILEDKKLFDIISSPNISRIFEKENNFKIINSNPNNNEDLHYIERYNVKDLYLCIIDIEIDENDEYIKYINGNLKYNTKYENLNSQIANYPIRYVYTNGKYKEFDLKTRGGGIKKHVEKQNTSFFI